jgi:hypothetical protein
LHFQPWLMVDELAKQRNVVYSMKDLVICSFQVSYDFPPNPTLQL